ncbi:hypothetical protein [Xanthomonas axonopodis]
MSIFNFGIETRRTQSVKGRWQSVRWIPNLATGEMLNIGVRFEEDNGLAHIRMLNDFDRIKCLYDEALASEARFLISVVMDPIHLGSSLPTPNVFLSEKKYASGPSASSVIEDLYLHVVPLARPHPKKRKERILVSNQTHEVRKIVFDEMRRISGLSADRIISSEKTLYVREGDDTHYLDIPLQTQRALGTIISTQSAPSNAELQLLRADSDLQIARRLYTRDKLLMYVVRNDKDEETDKFDDLIRRSRWKFNKLGVEMKDYSDASLVATDVLEDMLLNYTS